MSMAPVTDSPSQAQSIGLPPRSTSRSSSDGYMALNFPALLPRLGLIVLHDELTQRAGHADRPSPSGDASTAPLTTTLQALTKPELRRLCILSVLLTWAGAIAPTAHSGFHERK